MHERKLLSGICAAVFLMFLAGTWGNLRAQEAHLDVTSYPSDAHVSVDGMEMRKVTPLRVDLRLGTHQVKVYIPNSTWSPDTATKRSPDAAFRESWTTRPISWSPPDSTTAPVSTTRWSLPQHNWCQRPTPARCRARRCRSSATAMSWSALPTG